MRTCVKPLLEHRSITLDALLRGWVIKYLERIVTLPLNGARLVVMGLVPPIAEGEVYYGGAILPVAGSNAERVEYTLAMNQILAEECAARELPFLEMYDNHHDERGLISPEYSDGNVHVIKTQHVRAGLQRLGVIP